MPAKESDDGGVEDAEDDDRDIPSFEGQKVFKGNTSQEPRVDE